MPLDNAPTSQSVYSEGDQLDSISISGNFIISHSDRKDSAELHRKLTEKFGSKFTEILNKYGAYEYTTDCNGEILDILPPEEYLAHVDDLAKLRFGVGARDTSQINVTAGALADLAYAEAQYYAVEAEQFRFDPSVLIKHIEEVVLHRPEYLPDFYGREPTQQSLLGDGRFVGQMLRYALHNTLLQMGTWSLIVDYLCQVEELDNKSGRFGAEARRGYLMGCVKSVVEQEMEKVEKRVQYGIIFHLGEERLWYRGISSESHPEFSGAIIALHPWRESRMKRLANELTLIGAFTRFVVVDRTEDDFSPEEVETLRVDIFRHLNDAPEEWDKIGSFLAEQLTQLSRLMDFRDMLTDAHDVDPRTDEAYDSFVKALLKSEQLLTKTALERSIKSIDSLRNENIVRKIWDEIDATFLKDCEMLPERLIGFRQTTSQWFASRPTPAPPKPVLKVSVPEPKEKPARVKRSQRPRVPRAPSPAPADIQPYSYWTEAKFVSTTGDDDLVSERDVTKEKTRRSANTHPSESDVADQMAQVELEQATPSRVRTVTLLPRRIFNIVERIFGGGNRGQMRWTTFVKSMPYFGFSYDERHNGSKCKVQMMHSGGGSIVFHKPHPGSTLSPGQIRQNASNLTKKYGWTMDDFGLKPPSGEDDDDDDYDDDDDDEDYDD